jgi:hypothetical protein
MSHFPLTEDEENRNYWSARVLRNPWVRIERCSDPHFWYADRVGQEIRIEKVDRDGLWAREGGNWNPINIIQFEDVIPVVVRPASIQDQKRPG